MIVLPRLRCFVLVVLATFPVRLPAESLGPLERSVPSAGGLPGLERIYGDPKYGMPLPLGYDFQRIGHRDAWCVELGLGGQVGVMELNEATGLTEVREIISAGPEWCLSRDGALLLAERRDGSPWKAVVELFNFKTGEPVWSVGERLYVADVAFTPDGKEAVVLECRPGAAVQYDAVISWYTTDHGTLSRRVEIPKALNPVDGTSGSSFMGVTDRAVYLALPTVGEHGAEPGSRGWVVRNGSDTAERFPLVTEDTMNNPQVRVGGAGNDLVAVYNDRDLELFLESDKGVETVYQIDIAVPRAGHTSREVRFSPDQTKLVVSALGDTRILPVRKTGGPESREFAEGGRLTDFTMDGRSLVTFTDAGGELRDAAGMQASKMRASARSPSHCCPPASAEFVMDDSCILSNDRHSLLLWSAEGELMAQLLTPNARTRGRYQLEWPVFATEARKIYAVDGWDFLCWDLLEIARREGRGEPPKIEGARVFDERETPIEAPERMNIALDDSGTRLVTGTRDRFVYRLIGEPDRFVRLKVPEREIFLGPRGIHLAGTPPRIVVNIGRDAYELDPKGEAEPVRITTDWKDPGTQEVDFKVVESRQGCPVLTGPAGDVERQKMELPVSWKGRRIGILAAPGDGRWVILRHAREGCLPYLAVVDWERREVVRDFRLDSETGPTSLSEDGNDLLLPMHNRTVYRFDVGKLCEAGE